MFTMHTQMIEKNGKKEYVIIPYKDFLKIQEALEDYHDLRCLREAREAEKDAPTVGMAEFEARLEKRIARANRSHSKRNAK